jgi:hypothetical protein
MLDKIAFTVTGDLGCEMGGGPSSFATNAAPGYTGSLNEGRLSGDGQRRIDL